MQEMSPRDSTHSMTRCRKCRRETQHTRGHDAGNVAERLNTLEDTMQEMSPRDSTHSMTRCRKCRRETQHTRGHDAGNVAERLNTLEDTMQEMSPRDLTHSRTRYRKSTISCTITCIQQCHIALCMFRLSFNAMRRHGDK